jgi:hypothetical protein
MRGLFLLALALAATLVACGSDSSAGSSTGTGDATSLTVTYRPNGSQSGPKQTWSLRCEPAGGTLSRPAAACRRLAAGGAELFAGVPKDVVCTQIYGGPQTGRVVGTLQGERVSASFSRSDGCQIERWERVSPWLLPRGGVI